MRWILILLIPLSFNNLLGQTLLDRINSSRDEYGMTFVNNDFVLFTRDKKIYFTKRMSDLWSEPVLVSFNSEYGDEYPSFDPVTNRLYFSSKRPRPKTSLPLMQNDIWYTRLIDTKWSNPIHLEGSFSTHGIDSGGFGIDDLIYFHSDRGGRGLNYVDIYQSIIGSNVAEKLSISSDKVDGEVFLFGEGNAMLFMSGGHESIGNSDIFFSWKENERWQKPIPVDTTGIVNTTDWDYNPVLSHDEKTLYFTRYLDGQGDIFSIKLNELSSYTLLKRFLVE
ncbi:MAG: hypothetical protein RIM99_13705 [Cyclobacteriaceae bacterium]